MSVVCTLRLALDIQIAVHSSSGSYKQGDAVRARTAGWHTYIMSPVILPTDLILIPQVFACSHAIRITSPARQSLILT